MVVGEKIWLERGASMIIIMSSGATLRSDLRRHMLIIYVPVSGLHSSVSCNPLCMSRGVR